MGLWPIFNVPGVKKNVILTIFGHVLANLDDFLTEKKKINKTKKLHLVLEDVRKLFFPDFYS